MANYSYTSSLSGTKTTAQVGVASTAQAVQASATSLWSPSIRRGDVSLNAHTAGVPGNLVLSSDGSVGVSTESMYTETVPGWLTGRRPTTGQLYPRGVFNK